MKKALDYVSDHQLKSACKDAICIAPSKVTRMIFAVLEDWYHHIVLTHSCKQPASWYELSCNLCCNKYYIIGHAVSPALPSPLQL